MDIHNPNIPPQVPQRGQTNEEYAILDDMARRKRKKRSLLRILIVLIVLGALGYGGYWFAVQQGWLLPPIPTRPPTAEERARMEQVEDVASQQAPDAVPGAGVRPRGTLPPQTVPPATGTSTETGEATDEPTEDGTTSADAQTTPVDLEP
jgi:hypothetical protein